MIFTFFKHVLLITLFSFTAAVVASQFSNPYQGNVIVGSLDEAKLKTLALKQVLIKVSGNSDIGAINETKLLLRKSQTMLSQYGYRNIKGTEYFSAVFDQRKINQALQEMQQPVWGDTRPTTLIWLIHHNALVSEQTIIQNNDVSLSDALQKTQVNRGIGVQFPLMDLDDNLALSVSDVRGRFYDSLANASARYSRKQFVVAELIPLSSGKWRLKWQLVRADKSSKQQNVLINENFIAEKSTAIQKMVNTLADYYAGQYAIFKNKGEKLTQTLHIKGVDTLAELAKLNTLFTNLYAIDSYYISTVEGDNMRIEVKINGGLASFKNALIAQSNLQLDSSPPLLIDSIAIEDLEVTEADNKTLIDEDNVEVVKTEALYFNWR